MTQLLAQIQQRYHESIVWENLNPILKAGEIGIESNTGKFKVGNGKERWKELDYAFGVGLNRKIFNGYDNEKSGEQRERVGDFTDSSLVFRLSQYRPENHPGELIIVPRQYTINKQEGEGEITETFVMDTPYISLRKNNKWFWVVFSDQKNKAMASSALGTFVLGMSTLA